MKTTALVFVGLSLVLTVAAMAAPGPKEQAFKVGKKGEITLSQPTKAGDTVLQGDTYVVSTAHPETITLRALLN